MTASRADRIEAQVTRLAEIVDKLAARELATRMVFESGYDAGREAATRWRNKASAPSRKAANSHLTLVR